MTSPPSVGTTPDAAAEPGLLALLGELYVAPLQAFERIAARPRAFVALLLLTAINVCFAALWLSRLDAHEFLRAQAAAAGQPAPPEGVPAGLVKGSIFVSAVVAQPILLAAAAGVLLFLFKVLRGAELNYGQSLGVVAWASLAVSSLTTPLMALVMALKGDWNLNPQQVLQASVGAFFDPQALSKPWHALLSGLDLFTLWLALLLAAGFGRVTRRGISWAALPVFGLWALLLGLAVAFSAL